MWRFSRWYSKRGAILIFDVFSYGYEIFGHQTGKGRLIFKRNAFLGGSN
jgi:hypothetical protein